MTEIFEVAMRHIFREEGGKAELVGDSGGLTNYGISIKFAGSIHLDIDGDGKTTRADIEGLTPQKALEIYLEHFWLKARCHELPDPIALAHMDAAVNLGVGRSIRMLQKGLNVSMAGRLAVDGDFGQITRGAIGRMRALGLERPVLMEMIARRGEWYASLDHLKQFRLGWMRRLARTQFLADHLLITGKEP